MTYGYSRRLRSVFHIGSVSLVLFVCNIPAQAANVALSQPAEGATVSGPVTIAATVSSSVVWINFYLDGGYLTSSPPYSISWNSTAVGNGGHSILVNAYGSGGSLIGSASASITVYNASAVTITAPSNGATVSGSVKVSSTLTPAALWANYYIDGRYWTSGPPLTSYWNSTTDSNGRHTLSAQAFDNSGAGIGSSSVNVKVENLAPTPSPTPTPSINAYYIDSVSGSDWNSGRSPASPWQSLTKVQNFIATLPGPGTQILFARGRTWSGGLVLPKGLNGSASNRIIFGIYGSGSAPVIDGASSAPACFYARGTGTGSTPLWSYITINGLECRNTTDYGVLFYQNVGGSAGMPGIIVENMYIHNTGPGAYAGGGGPFDDGNYRNQLMFLDENVKPDGVRFLNNVVHNCGGHNCIQVQLDTGSPLIQGNLCYGFDHNCIDTKEVVGGVVENNIVHGPGDPVGNGGGALFLENLPEPGLVLVPHASVSFVGNTVYQSSGSWIWGLQCEGDSSSTTSSCKAYNNTLYLGGQSAIVTATTANTTWDVRNNILDTSDPLYVCGTNNSNWCHAISIWDYNDNGGSRGVVNVATRGPHDLIGANPLYVNAAAANFHLQAGSPCINAGQPGLDGLTDIGAY